MFLTTFNIFLYFYTPIVVSVRKRLNPNTTIHMPQHHMHSPIHRVEGRRAGPW